MNKTFYNLLITTILLTISGCESDNSDLIDYISNVNKRKGGAIEPLPMVYERQLTERKVDRSNLFEPLEMEESVNE